MSVLEQFANPELLDGLSFGDKLSGSIMVTILGMGITFLALIILMGATMLLSKLAYREAPAVVKVPAKKAVKKEVPIATEDDDEELIAVLSAAIAASTGKAVNSIVVRGYREVTNGIPAWSGSSLMNKSI